ncbi:aminotransferase class IV [Phenylobacterium montanum]|uniref:Probable branched-chain-amino-acid aminotransferase n=1 Tax=Phenylobacterium montanum TaxID=2823693 RepID=A0A975FXI3_9CAUL|nr:aminotransferase class IV [Caulobacter sp. S6]QUD86752.1 aminotransferase class IV [Caulobacter sp. S6]
MSEPIPVDDRGLLLGDGLFETLLADRGRLVWFEAHAARLARGCAALGLPAPEAETLRSAAEAAIAEADLSLARAAVRLTWTAGSGGRGLDRPDPPQPRLLASAASAPMADAPLALAVAPTRRNDASPISRLKSLSYLDNVLARREARALGADEALMLNTRGEVACAAVANLFWIAEGRLFTPALDCGVLDGIARGRVLAAAAALGVPTIETRAGLADPIAAEALFVSNSLMSVRPVRRLDDRNFQPHPLIAQLAERLAAEMAG